MNDNHSFSNPYPLTLFACGYNLQLAQSIAKKLKISLGPTNVKTFPDGDFFRYQTVTVRDHNIFVVAQFRNGDDKYKDIFEAITFITSLRQASPKSWITVIIPSSLPFDRQDKKSAGPSVKEPSIEPVLSQSLPILFKAVGADHLVVVKLHNPASCTNFPMIKMEDVDTTPSLIEHIRSKFTDFKNIKMVASDFGAGKSTGQIAKELEIPVAIIHKDRNPQTGKIEIMDVIGKVNGFTLILFDDILDTANTISEGVIALKERNCGDIHGVFTHPVLSGNALHKISEAGFKSVTLTNSCLISSNQISLAKELNINLEIVDISRLLAGTIYNLHNGYSINSPYDVAE